MKYFFLIPLMLIAFNSHGSISYGCDSKDKSFSLGLGSFDDGDGLWTLFSRFYITYAGESISTGFMSWFQVDDSGVSYTNFSATGRRIYFHAKKQDGSEYLKIEAGFVRTSDKTIDLKDLEIECMGG